MYWLLILFAVGAAIVAVLYLGSFSLRAGKFPALHHSSAAFRKTGYSVWRYEREEWKLKEDKSAAEFVPGAPPIEAGQFEGYCVKVTSVAKREAH